LALRWVLGVLPPEQQAGSQRAEGQATARVPCDSVFHADLF